MSDLVERLREYASDDHERLCEGREYTCSCGYDDKRDPLLDEAAARIAQLEEANELMLTDIRRTDVDMLAFKARIAQLEAALRVFTCDCEGKELCAKPDNCRNYVARAALGGRT